MISLNTWNILYNNKIVTHPKGQDGPFIDHLILGIPMRNIFNNLTCALKHSRFETRLGSDVVDVEYFIGRSHDYRE